MSETQDTAPDPEVVRAHRERVKAATDLWSALEVMRLGSQAMNAALTADDLAVVLAGLPEILKAALRPETREIRSATRLAQIEIPCIPDVVMRPEVRDFVYRSYRRDTRRRWMAAVPEEERLRMLEEMAEFEPLAAWDVWAYMRDLPGLGPAGLRPLLASSDPRVRRDAMRASADPMGELPPELAGPGSPPHRSTPTV